MSDILTMKEAAASLRVSRRWLQEFLKQIPPCHLQAGHKKLFDEIAMTKIRDAMREEARRSVRYIPPAKTSGYRHGTRLVSSPGSALAEALRLLNEGKSHRSKTAAQLKTKLACSSV